MNQELKEIIVGLYSAIQYIKDEYIGCPLNEEQEIAIKDIRSAITYLSLLPIKDDDETQALTPNENDEESAQLMLFDNEEE